MSVRRVAAPMLVAALTAAACGPDRSSDDNGAADAAPTSSREATETSDASSTTTTSTSTSTSEPPTTSAVDLDGPESVRYEGVGDEVITIEPGDALTREAYLLAAIHLGDGPFQVRVLDEVGELSDLLVDHTGRYVGFRPYNFFLGPPPGFLEVRTDEQWQIELIPVQEVPQRDSSPGTLVEGAGDTVFWFNVVAEPAVVDFRCDDCAGRVRIRALGTGADDLLDDIADGSPFDATIVVPLATLMLEVETHVSASPFTPPMPGNWTLTVQ